MHGLDAISDRMPDSTAVSTLDDRAFYTRARCRQILLGMGFSEAMHYSFLSAQELDAFDTRGASARAVLPNPVSADYGVLRDSLLPQLAGSLGRNAAWQASGVSLFEQGRVFFKALDGTPAEEERVALGMMGGQTGRGARSKEDAILALKGVVEQLAASLRAGALAFERTDCPAFEDGWAVAVTLDGQHIGCMGLLSDKLRHQWRVAEPMPLAELKLAPLLAKYNTGAVTVDQTAMSKYPAVRRDVALVAGADVTHRDVVETVRKAGPKELTGVELFDIFHSNEIGRGKRSMAYALAFRSPDRTLTDQEVNAAFAKIVQALKDGLGVEVREG